MRTLLAFALLLAAAPAAEKIPVLILTGRNNHDWKRSTPLLRGALEATGRFAVTVAESPPPFPQPPPPRPGKTAGEAEIAAHASAHAAWQAADRAFNQAQQPEWDRWLPDFKAHRVVVNDYNGRDWSGPMKAAFTAFVRDGGGLVNVHAANNGFRNWTEFNQMIGMGFRGADGPRWVVDDATSRPLELPAGSEIGRVGETAGHGDFHAFTVVHRRPEHPILRGLPLRWLHGKDELYHGQRGPALDLEILASAYSDPARRGSGRHEPVLWTTRFGAGRVVTTSLGHLWPGHPATDALDCPGFQALLTRSTEWAATGAVTLPPRPLPPP